MAGFADDPALDASTRRLMIWGVGLIVALLLAFPLYRLVEPASRSEARARSLASLEEEGSRIWSLTCAACHGADGEGGVGPALNSKQFLESATDDQARLLVSVGVPGTAMSAFGLDYGGTLTSEQIRAVAIYVRSWEEGAPDRPDWRTPAGQ